MAHDEGHGGSARGPTDGGPLEVAPEGSSGRGGGRGAAIWAIWAALPVLLRLALIGALLVGIGALLTVGDPSPETSAVGIALTLLTTGVVIGDRARRLSSRATTSALLAIGAVATVIGLLALLSVMRDADDPGRGDAIDLLAYGVGAAGGLLMLGGAVASWLTASRGTPREPLDGAERLAAGSGAGVAAAWAVMLLDPGWDLLLHQALAIAGATLVVVVVVVHASGISPLDARATRYSLVGLAAVTVSLALVGLVEAGADLRFIVEVGGPPAFMPFVAYLVCAACLGAAGVKLALGVPQHTVAGAGAAVLAVVVLFSLLMLAGPPPSGTLPTPTPADSARPTPAAVASPGDRPQVAPLDGCDLLTDEEVIEALSRPGTDTGQGSLTAIGRAEACSWERNTSDEPAERPALAIGPGVPDDFAPDFELDGIRGSSVEGVGDAARWFGGQAQGTLAVLQESSLGYVAFRLTVRRLDLDDAGRLAISSQLASMALPRFPGVEPPETEPDTATISHELPDTSNLSYVDNLLVKERAGQWARGEGLLATLRLMLGEAGASDVLRHGEVLESEATGIIEMAFDYLRAEPNDVASADISRLLDQIVLSNEELQEMAGIGPPEATLVGYSQSAPSTAQAARNCQEFFAEPQLGVGKCLEFQSVSVNGKVYRVFYPAPSLPRAGWLDTHFALAVQAVEESVQALDRFGQTPAANIVFAVAGREYGYAFYWGENEPCSIVLDTKIRPYPDDHFKQVIAHELGHCFNGHTFVSLRDVADEDRHWWEEGLSEYLSNVVYPSSNLEHSKLGPLAAAELSTTLFDRAYSNSFFFQHVENRSGVNGAIAIIRTLPTSGAREDQEAALAAKAGMAEDLDLFARGMTDATIADTGGGVLPYIAPVTELAIDGHYLVLDDPPPFGVTRLQLIVAAGKHACLRYEQEGELRAAWRSGRPGVSGTWSDQLPAVLQGEAVVVITTAAPGARFTAEAYRLVDDPADCDPDPGSGGASPSPLPTPCPLGCDPSSYFHYLSEVFRRLIGLFD